MLRHLLGLLFPPLPTVEPFPPPRVLTSKELYERQVAWERDEARGVPLPDLPQVATDYGD
jgi:hypothetical protein